MKKVHLQFYVRLTDKLKYFGIFIKLISGTVQTVTKFQM